MPNWENRFCLNNKIAFITGASSGIGYEIAKVFSDAGADIVAHGRDNSRLSELGKQVVKKNKKFKSIIGNLDSDKEAEAIALKALEAFGRVDILVNSAGIAITGPLTTYSIADWNRTISVNLTAPFIITKILLPDMMKRRCGKIINISSQTGVIALKDHSSYAASKGALNAFTKAAMTEAAPFNVQVNAICPTVVLTKMGKKLWLEPKKKDPFLSKTPLGRFGEPEEIADMALYLASPASDLVNGALMMIEGGYSSV